MSRYAIDGWNAERSRIGFSYSAEITKAEVRAQLGKVVEMWDAWARQGLVQLDVGAVIGRGKHGRYVGKSVRSRTDAEQFVAELDDRIRDA